MKRLHSFRSRLQTTPSVIQVALAVGLVFLVVFANAQETAAPQDSKPKNSPPAQSSGPNYSGMYSFLKDGEFLQVTIEDGGTVTGYVSRFGDGESDKGAFLDQFFKNGKLDGNKLTFTTEIVHGVAFDFRGNFERGEGKNPGDEAYYILKGMLTENVTDISKKVTSHSRDVIFKSFPQEAGPVSEPRK